MHLNSSVGGEDVSHRADEEHGSDEQYDRGRDLEADQPAPHRATDCVRRPARAVQQRAGVAARQTERRIETDGHRRDDAQADGECQNARVDVELVDAGHEPRAQQTHDASEHDGEHHAQRGADESEQTALEEQLAHDSAAGRTECGAHRQLAAATQPSGELRAHQVRAGDEQHEYRGGEHDGERQAVAADDVVVKRREIGVDGRRFVAVGGKQCSRERGHLGACCRLSDVRCQPADDAVVAARSTGAGLLLVRKVQVGVVDELEPGARDTDHGHRRAADLNHTQRLACVHLCLPEIV